LKKLFHVITICILLLALPMTTAISSPLNQLFKPNNKALNFEIKTFEDTKEISTKDSPPKWAKGNFSGEWGLDIWGEYHIPLGWMLGYYKLSMNIGYFAAGFNFFGEYDISWFIQGFFFGIFMFGSMGENEYTNQTFFVGIGKYSENKYHWRLIGEHGPTFFMRGTYTKFD